MFGVDFSELMVIMVIALIVIGPERLPKVARTLGHLWGRAQRYINGVKADIARDMAVDEFRQLQQQVQQEADSARQAVKQTAQEWNQEVQQFSDAIEPQAIVQASASDAPPLAVPPSASAAQQQTQLELQPPAAQHKSPVD